MDSAPVVPLQVAEELAEVNDERYRTVHVPEDPIPPHYCQPKNYVGGIKSEYKDRSIIECNDCGIFWWCSVFTTGGRDFLPLEHHIHWAKVRWYHFRLRKFTR